jgi:hypothetical protein
MGQPKDDCAVTFDGWTASAYMAPSVVLYGVSVPGEGTTWPRPSITTTDIRIPNAKPDPLGFVRPLLDAELDVLDACLLYSACDKDINKAMALVYLARLASRSKFCAGEFKPIDLAQDGTTLKAAMCALRPAQP